MNNKKIKNLLKQKADNVKLNKDLPASILEKVQSGADFEPDLAHNNGVVMQGVKTSEKSKKPAYRSIIPIFAGAIAMVIVVVSVILPLFNKQVKPPITVKAEEVFSKEMFALGNLISHQEEEIALFSLSESEFEKICNECSNYLLTGDAFLQKENITSSVYKNTGEQYKEYEYVARVQFVDVSKFTTEYISYYNENKKGNKTYVSGVMIIGGKEYPLEGEHEHEHEEIESELRIYLNGKQNYISVSNETEVNENEYTYEWVKNGDVVKGVSLEVEYEDNLKKTEIEITENENEQSYEFIYYEQTIFCEYESEYHEEEFVIYIHDEYYLFEHEDYKIRVDK